MLSTAPTKHQCNLAISLPLSNSRQSCITQTWTTTTMNLEFNKELTVYISSKAKWPHTTHCHHASLLQPLPAYTPMHYLTVDCSFSSHKILSYTIHLDFEHTYIFLMFNTDVRSVHTCSLSYCSPPNI